MIESILVCFVLFLSGALTDVAWALYNKHNLDTVRRFKASNWSVITGLGSWLLVQGDDVTKISGLFWLAGLWVGTYYAFRIEAFIKQIFMRKK